MHSLEIKPFDPNSDTSLSTVKEVSGDRFNEIESIGNSGKYKNADEKWVWEEFKRGDESAFIHIYLKYFGELLNFGLQFTRDKNLIEDIIQNVFIHLRNKRPALPKLKSSVRLFLFQCLKRKILDYQKTNRYILSNQGLSDAAFEIVLAEDSRMIDDQNKQERIEKLRQSIDRLNAKQREVIYYFYYKDLSYEEIKILMGFNNVKSARNLVYKAISLLKKLIA